MRHTQVQANATYQYIIDYSPMPISPLPSAAAVVADTSVKKADKTLEQFMFMLMANYVMANGNIAVN